jgi:hypothetical protein
MKKILATISLAAIFPVCSFGAPTNNSEVAGVWRATIDGLPAMTLTVEEHDGKLMGAALFFTIRRQTGTPTTSTPGVPEPLIEPRFDSKVLRFKVVVGNPELPNPLPHALDFEITDLNKGRLLIEGRPGMEFTREQR